MRQTAVLSLLLFLLLCSRAMAQQSIIGKWEGHSPQGDIVSYEFKEDNTVSWTLDKPGFPGPITARYTVDYMTKPMQLDMFEFSYGLLKDIRFLGIIEFPSPDKMRMDGIRVEKEEEDEDIKRPKEFSWQAIEFDKVE